MKRKRLIFIYALGDYLTALLAWALFFNYRKFFIEAHPFNIDIITSDNNFWLGIFTIPFFWMFIYFMFGFYKDVYRKSRLLELWKTLVISLTGCIFLFFALILDDVIFSYKTYYYSFMALFITYFFPTIIWKLFLTTLAKNQLKNKTISFNTLMIGGNEKAVGLYNEVELKKQFLGYKFIGFIDVNGNSKNPIQQYIPKLGELKGLEKAIEEHQIEEVIIAIETSEHDKINRILNCLNNYDVVIKIIPDIYDIIIGSVKVTNVFGATLIEIYPDITSTSHKVMKRIFDIIVSVLTLIILSPLYLYIAVKVKLSSKGPIIYEQERIGLHGIPFKIYKYRSMYENAELNGPALSSKRDKRITPWGKIMRKWRLDELPQFYNVLTGSMSLVGPRPERQYYIDQIVKKAPHYKYLHKVKPGITSLGQVQFGYASNVDEMIERMKYNLLYIENMSLALDFKIMLYTLLTIIQGKGK